MSVSPLDQALLTIQRLFDDLEARIPPLWDIDMDDRSLTLTTHAGAVFLITIHGPSGQIWLSSPLSGGHHFDYHESQSQWVSTKQSASFHVTLDAILFKDLAQVCPAFETTVP